MYSNRLYPARNTSVKMVLLRSGRDSASDNLHKMLLLYISTFQDARTRSKSAEPKTNAGVLEDPFGLRPKNPAFIEIMPDFLHFFHIFLLYECLARAGQRQTNGSCKRLPFNSNFHVLQKCVVLTFLELSTWLGKHPAPL